MLRPFVGMLRIGHVHLPPSHQRETGQLSRHKIAHARESVLPSLVRPMRASLQRQAVDARHDNRRESVRRLRVQQSRDDLPLRRIDRFGAVEPNSRQRRRLRQLPSQYGRSQVRSMCDDLLSTVGAPRKRD